MNGDADMGECSILKGILQNGSSYNYPAVRFGRVPKREKARILAAMQSSRLKTQESKVLAEMTDDGKIIETVVRAHYDTCDYTRNKMEPFLAKARASPSYAVCTGTTCPMKGRPENSFLEQFSERFMDHVRQVCTFAKLIPGFKCLHHDDQVTLLKSCVFEVLLVRLAGLFENQGLICLNGDIIRKDTINQMPPGNAKSLMDSVFDLAQRINRFQLSDAEIGLFCAVVIITPDRPGLRNADLVQRMQSKLKMVFNSILLPKHSDHASIFSELMTMIHDLRTLNTLHTEKFLQQCKVQPNSTPPSAQQNQQPTSTNWHNPQQVERESTGNASPQSSSSEDGGGSSNSSNRRSPISSVSSSGESICSNEVSKLTHGELKVSGNVLMNALTVADQAAAAAAAAANTASSSAATVTTVSRKRVAAAPAPTAEESKAATGTAAATVTKHKVRKLDSPSDSGIDSPKAGTSHGSHSTNTSVCSSPRSSSTEDDARTKAEKNDKAEKACPPSSSSSSSSASTPAAGNPAAAVVSAAASASAVEEQHPLLKRALEQPPQPYNEVYRPHKKFRRHNIPVSDDVPSSTSTNQASPQSPPPPPPPPAAHCSLLVSQLSEPPLSHRQSQQHSLLASTLNAPVASSRESRRNEILASLILNNPPPTPAPPAAAAASSGTAAQGLLMCAKPAAVTAASEAAGSQPPSSRHIPVQAAPMKPPSSSSASSSSSSAASKMSQLAAAAAAVESSSSTSTSSSDQSEAQPLNLSTRTPPPPTSTDIPTEA